jgi:hypothetical protein
VANSFHPVEKEEYRDSYYQRNHDENPFMRYIDATDIVVYKLEEEMRERLGDMTPKLKRLMRREWLVDRVLRNGFLWVGGLANCSSNDNKPSSVFDVDEPVQVLTPHCTGLFGPARDKIRLERMSWRVEPQFDGQGFLLASGMVRGMWNIEGAAPECFTLV